MRNIFKNKNKITIITLFLCIFILFYFCTICYSAFSSTMNINGIGFSRVEADVRITDFSICDTTNSSISMYENFSKNTISSEVSLKSNSSITYNLEITNYGSVDVGIYSISGLPDGVNYSIDDYNLKDKICDDSGKCNSYAVKTYSLKVYTTTSSYEGVVNLEFDFRIFHNITYSGFSGGYISEVMDGDSIEIDFSLETIEFLNVYGDDNVSYEFDNNILSLKNVSCDVYVENIKNTKYDFDYTGDVQTFVVPYTGVYNVELWGAQGGSYSTYIGGYGAYSTGEVRLEKDDILYVYVGGQGGSTGVWNATISGGWNGGGDAEGYWTGTSNTGEYKESGGGATHIAFSNNFIKNITDLEELLVVAAGGAGATYFSYNGHYIYCNGGVAGGIVGGVSSCSGSSNITSDFGTPTGASQTSGGINIYSGGSFKGSFGQGGSGYTGGGGGYYGGAGGYGIPGGGSSYIGNSLLLNKHMTCYNCTTSGVESTKTISTTNVSDSPISDYSKKGNGYCKISLKKIGREFDITYVDILGDYQDTIIEGDDLIVDFGSNAPLLVNVFINDILTDEYEYNNGVLTIYDVSGNLEIRAPVYRYDYTGGVQTFSVPYSGIYKLESWGAQGGSYNSSYYGGYGAYTSGEIELIKGQQIYVYVGGQGKLAASYNGSASGGWNGGGSAGGIWSYDNNGYEIKSSGGGATHFSFENNFVKDIFDLNNLITVAAGGSGATYFKNDGGNYAYCKGGSGGGISGSFSSCSTDLSSFLNDYTAANQTKAGYVNFDGAINNGLFGAGGDGYSGGGSGYYGGAGGYLKTGGGSSYVGNSLLTNKLMSCYSCTTSSVESTKTVSTTNVSSTPVSSYAKSGNGYAKITLLELK